MDNQLFETDNKIIIYTDGGARGNPGPAAIGVLIGRRKYGEKIGRTTNNVAEYEAVIFALNKLKTLLGKKEIKSVEVEVRLDSELVVKHLNGQYKIKNADLIPLFIEVWNTKQEFKKVEFVHIPREKNAEADKLVNMALDNE